MKKAAIIPCKGIGDGLVMMVAAFAFYQQGFEVTLYHPHISELQDWFFPFFSFSEKQDVLKKIDSYDAIVVQNDNSPFILHLKELQKKGAPIHVIYPTYEKGKHDLSPKDLLLSPDEPIAKAIGSSMKTFFNSSSLSSSNGMIYKKELSYRKEIQKIILHPTSTAQDRTWSQKKFLHIYKKLEQQGYNPIFVLSNSEKADWKNVIKMGYRVISFSSLSNLADYIYESGYLIGNESGLSHLASSLSIPTLVIAGLKKRILQWQPGWGLGRVIYPSSLIPNIKRFRIRDDYWQYFISPRRVEKEFAQLVLYSQVLDKTSLN